MPATFDPRVALQSFDPASAPSFSTRSAQNTATRPEKLEEKEDAVDIDVDAGRDPGVSDAVWKQLQADKQAEEAARRAREAASEKARRELQAAAELEARVKAEKADAERRAAQAKEQRERDEMKRRLEELRMQELRERQERERRVQELERRRRAEEEERKKEAKAQAALRQMGVCVAGYRWIKQSGGYRCAGGSHFVGDAEIGL